MFSYYVLLSSLRPYFISSLALDRLDVPPMPPSPPEQAINSIDKPESKMKVVMVFLICFFILLPRDIIIKFGELICCY